MPMHDASVGSVDAAHGSGTADLDISRWTAKRRDFLRMLGVGTGAAALGPMAGFSGLAHASAASDPMRAELMVDAKFWSDVQSMFVLNPSKAFMNIGTAGSLPLQALELLQSETLARARDSLSGYTNLLDQRKAVAPGFGVDPDELAFSANTSSGMCHAILGLDWKAGDVIISTNHEHSGGNVPMAIAQDRYGIEVSRIDMPVGNKQTAQTYVDLFEQRIQQLRRSGKRVRALMWSSPTYKTGTMLPVAELVEVAKKNELISIVDGAHLPGMMAYDYGRLGMDFMSGAGHKWQCGPGSTGILVIRNKIRASNPLPLPKWYPIHSSAAYTVGQARTTNATATYDIAAAVSTCGSVNTPVFNTLVKSCGMWDSVGRKKIETYVMTLSKYLKEKLAERWGVDRLYAPKDDPKLLSALSSFNPFVNPADITNGKKSGEFVTRMATEYSPAFVIRNVNVAVIGSAQDHFPVRVSTHLWSDAADIDRLVDAMWDLSRKMA